MLLAEAPDGPFSVRFRIGPFPVSIGPSFWVVALLPMLRTDPGTAAIWVTCVFVSVLVHELGHAVACWGFNLPARIRLYAFGGLTFHPSSGRRSQIIISLAGPFTGFSLGALVYVATPLLPMQWPYLAQVSSMLMRINFLWGVVNLLPVPPLDGGHVLEHLLGPGRQRTTRLVATLAAAAAGAAGIVFNQIWVATFFLMLAVLHGAAWLGERKRPRLLSRSRRRRGSGRLFGARTERLREEPPALPVPLPVAGGATQGVEALEAVTSAETAYQEAKRLAQRGDTRAAARWLHRAMQLGYEDLRALNSDPDLEQVRREPEIAAVLDPLGLWTRRSGTRA